MVVLVIDNFSVHAYEPEGDTPVAAHPHSPDALPFALQGMKAKTRKTHIFDSNRGVQATKDQAQSLAMRGLDPCLGASLEEPGQALVLEASDHEIQCNLSRYG